jgi:hypothetical protein
MVTSRSQFPAMYEDKLTYHHDARGMNTTPTLSVEPSLRPVTADVEVVVPVYNEQDELAASINRLHTYLTRNFPLSWLITVADNSSTDSTWAIACHLARELDGVRAVHLAQKGRGRALRMAWLQSSALVVAYMDVDLSTDLDALLPLVAPLVTGHSDVAIGSRLAPGARVVRGAKRELISRMYNLILRVALRNSFSDAQCGFKAMRAEVARQLLPLVKDNGWFFDTELLVVAERNGLRVHEVAVDWVDNPGSTVDIVRTARDDLKGIARLMRPPPHGQGEMADQPVHLAAPRRPAPSPAGELVHFAGVGVVSTVSFAVFFALLYGSFGAAWADVVAVSLCAAGSLVAGRRCAVTPKIATSSRRYFGTAVAVSLLPLASTLCILMAVSATGAASLPVDIIVLTAAVFCSALGRFYFWRRWAGTVR